jgi:hypothetical protein
MASTRQENNAISAGDWYGCTRSASTRRAGRRAAVSCRPCNIAASASFGPSPTVRRHRLPAAQPLRDRGAHRQKHAARARPTTIAGAHATAPRGRRRRRCCWRRRTLYAPKPCVVPQQLAPSPAHPVYKHGPCRADCTLPMRGGARVARRPEAEQRSAPALLRRAAEGAAAKKQATRPPMLRLVSHGRALPRSRARRSVRTRGALWRPAESAPAVETVE